MKNKKTEGEDGRQKTTAAGARATAPPSQNEEQDEEDDDVESSNDGLGRRESREQLAPGGLRRLNRHVNRYLDLLRQVRGIANATVTGKDKGVFRSWLQDQPDDEAVRKVLDGFVRDDDPFVRRNGWSLALLPRRANGYLAIDLGSASPAGPAGDSRGGVQPETDERIRILREAFSKAWSEKYRRPRVEGTERSETKAALKAISHYDAAGESEPFDRWAARIARAYMDIEDEYIVRSAHAFPLLPCRLDRICAAPATPRRERGVREQDWADTDDAGRQEEEVH